ncbi:hypothetical protein CYY_006188 [Polysphondylium violaceum]|uniref:ComC supersandwich domain-containing protein n=1 Tax=Polysphondylium violaceum TaxID=133409 RepID=A0A8J4PSN5_9MYCE|nr:hypothetical protein CYY_006188 [Polysphondylium violaceum]
MGLKYNAILFYLLFIISNVYFITGQDITSCSPSIIMRKYTPQTVTLYGAFSLGTRTIVVNDVDVMVTITSTSSFEVTIPALTNLNDGYVTFSMNAQYKFMVPLVTFNAFVQDNSIGYLLGSGFSSSSFVGHIQVATPDKMLSSQTSVVNETALSFMMMGGFSDPLNIYDVYSNVFIGTIDNVKYKPLITRIDVFQNELKVIGAFYNRYPVNSIPEIKVDNYICSFINETGISLTQSTIFCTPPREFFGPKKGYQVLISNANGTSEFSSNFPMTVDSFEIKDSTTTISGSNFTNSMLLNGIGSPSTLYTFINSSQIFFIFPQDISCGLFYSSDSYTKIRLSKNLLICQKPLILSIGPAPSPTVSSILTITGKFIIESSVDTLENSLIFRAGSGKPCFSNQFDSSTNISTIKCNVDPGSGSFTFKSIYKISNLFGEISYRYNPYIESITPTKFGTPSTVTIVGRDFNGNDLIVRIGGSFCSNIVVSQSFTQITCLFQSNITVNSMDETLDVFVGLESTFNSTAKIFLYTKPTIETCPKGSNGLICSGHGTCNQQLQCECEKDWESSDCSFPSLGVVIDKPIVNENNTTSVIVTPSGNKYDIGIAMINELDSNSNIIQSININNIKWLNITKENTTHIYTTTLDNKSTLQVTLTINDKDERVYYNFAGDIIPILPKSIKYQIAVHNWTFGSTQNTIDIIFKSGITESTNDCSKQEQTSTTSAGDSIRNIQISLNGETLIGTFSDRIILDNRPSYNKVSQLTKDQINKYQLESLSTIYISISASYFKNSVVVDPNFGVLVSSVPDQCSNSKFESWKIAVIVVCSVIGIAAIVGLILFILKNSIKTKIFAMKLKPVTK